MNLQTYRERRLIEQATLANQFRPLCFKCFQPGDNCYCSEVQSFDPHMTFAILIDGIEARRRIATGRMSHLSLQTSRLIRGQDYSLNPTVNRLIEDPAHYPVILYPGPKSINLTELNDQQRADLFPKDRRLAVFVIDGTWNSARKMIRSRNLIGLPRISFSPPQESNFRVRKQPKAGCLSTIEAIHHSIELLGASQGFDPSLRTHDRLLRVFDHMVERQLQYVANSYKDSRRSRHHLHAAAPELFATS